MNDFGLEEWMEQYIPFELKQEPAVRNVIVHDYPVSGEVQVVVSLDFSTTTKPAEVATTMLRIHSAMSEFGANDYLITKVNTFVLTITYVFPRK